MKNTNTMENISKKPERTGAGSKKSREEFRRYLKRTPPYHCVSELSVLSYHQCCYLFRYEI